MQLLLFLVAGGGLSYFLAAHRRCDLFTLAFVSSCVYFLPGFFGSVPDGVYGDVRVPLEPETYAVMTTVLGAILAGAWCWDPSGAVADRDAPDRPDPVAPQVAFLFAVVGLAMAIQAGGSALFSASKIDVMAALSRWFLLLAIAASLALVLSFLQRQWIWFAASGGLLLFTVYVGFRWPCAMAVISVFLVHLHRQGCQRLAVRHRTSLLLICGATVFFFAYKFIYTRVKLGQMDSVAQSLADPEFYIASVTGSEPFATQMVLNEVLRSGFQTDAGYILQSVAAQFTLFSGEFGLEFVNFNELFQPQLFADVHYGLAANIWAQMLAAGGWSLFLGFLAVFVCALRLGSVWLATSRMATRAGVAVGAAYWSFYIHRNDLGNELNLLKRVLLVWLAMILVSEALHRLGAVDRRRRIVRAPARSGGGRSALALK